MQVITHKTHQFSYLTEELWAKTFTYFSIKIMTGNVMIISNYDIHDIGILRIMFIMLILEWQRDDCRHVMKCIKEL